MNPLAHIIEALPHDRLAAGAGAALVSGWVAYGTFAPTSRFWGPVISRAPDDAGPAVALTFDDGPTHGPTDRILDTLRELDAPAAFFVVGRNVEQWPQLVQRMHAEGHLVANHTQDHSHYGILRRGLYWRRQLDETNQLVQRLIGKRPALFRPPMGFKTWHVTQAARCSGHRTVTWSRRALDSFFAPSAQRIVDRLVSPSRAGDVLMLHDGIEPHSRHRDRSAVEAAVRPLVLGLRARGLQLRRLDRLLGIEPYARDAS